MSHTAERIAEAAGFRRDLAHRLLAMTEETAGACLVDPQDDIGLGHVHFPEPRLVGAGHRTAARVLRSRCAAGMVLRGYDRDRTRWDRLHDELRTIERLGYPSYFLTVSQVVDDIREMGIRVAARGSGAGSLVNHLLGIAHADPVEHGLLMERFLSERRAALPDIDIDVESARRLEVYRAIFDRFGAERVATVSMPETYRVRHAVRDVGAALGMDPAQVDRLAKAFPHIRARDARAALAELPELRGVREAGGERLWPAGRGAGRAAARDRHAPVRGAALGRHAAGPYAGRPDQRRGLRDVPVRQGGRGGPGAAQARCAGRADAVRDGACGRRDRPGHRAPDRPRRPRAGAARRRRDLRPDPLDRDARLLPDRVAGPARPGRQASARHLPRSGRRHLPLPAGAGRRRYGAALHRGPARPEAGPLSAPRPGGTAARDLRGGGVPRADHRAAADHDGLRTGRGGREAARAVASGAPGQAPRLVRPARRAARLYVRSDRAHLGDRRGLRLVRLLQGACGGLRGAHLPVRLAQGAPPRGLLRRAAHPRPRDVPEAAAARGCAAARGAGAAAGCEPVGGRSPDRTGVRFRWGWRAPLRRGLGAAARALRCARHERGRGAADRGRAALPLAPGSVAAGQAEPPGGRTPRPGGRVGRLRREPAGSAAVPRRAAPPRAADVRWSADAAGRGPRQRGRGTDGSGRSGRAGGAARPQRCRTAQRRAGRPRHGRLPPSDGRPPGVPRGAGRAAGPAAARRQARRDGAGRRSQGGHPDTADPLRPPGHLHHPGRQHGTGRLRLLRRQPRGLCAHRLPLLAAAGARYGPAARSAQLQRGRRRRLEPRRAGRTPARGRAGGGRRPARDGTGHTGRRGGGGEGGREGADDGADGTDKAGKGLPGEGSEAGREAEPAAAPGRTIRLETGYELHPWADLQPPGERAATGRKLWHSSPGSAG